MPGVSCPPVIPARISVITLGARDIDSLCDFYRALGWTAAIELDDFAAFETKGAVLTLYRLENLARDARVDAGADSGLPPITIAINVDRAEQVDETIAAVKEAGGSVTQEPVDMEWGGRSAYFADPENNLWEVAWVPPDSKMAALVVRATGGERTA
jgi:catechol 2,3-dioxygenase-like lactoylglutathione lyase family enzyme